MLGLDREADRVAAPALVAGIAVKRNHAPRLGEGKPHSTKRRLQTRIVVNASEQWTLEQEFTLPPPRLDRARSFNPKQSCSSVMIEKSAPSRWARFVSGLLDLNHTRIINFASVLQIAKFVPSSPHNETSFAIRTLGSGIGVRTFFFPCIGSRLQSVQPVEQLPNVRWEFLARDVLGGPSQRRSDASQEKMLSICAVYLGLSIFAETHPRDYPFLLTQAA